MNYSKVISIIKEIAPPQLAEEWDNSGVQINVGNDDIRRVLVCLEITHEVIDEAIEKDCDMIISHHPLIFGGINSVDMDGDPAGSMIIRLVEADISVYSAHTSFDSAPMGNNYYLAKLLGLTNISKPFDGENAEIGVIGNVQGDKKLKDIFIQTSEVLGRKRGQICVVGIPDTKITKVGICTGAGVDFMKCAMASGCQVLITGDVKFHDAMYAKNMGFALIDAGHYGTEKIFAENFAAQLRERAGDGVEVIESCVNIDPFVV